MESSNKEVEINCKSIQEAFKFAFEKYDKHTSSHNKKPNKFTIKEGKFQNQKGKITGFETKKDDIKDTWCCIRVDFDQKKKTHINYSTLKDKFAFLFPSEDSYFDNLITELTDNFANNEDATKLIEKFRSFC